MPGYVLSREAETDLQEIVEYTATRYGVKQAVGYVRKLEKCAGQLAMAYSIYKQIKEVHPELFVKPLSASLYFRVAKTSRSDACYRPIA